MDNHLKKRKPQESRHKLKMNNNDRSMMKSDMSN